MALQNIGVANKDDAFYRYKMPKIQTKIEGRGNGIKTKLENMVAISKALGRPTSYPTKFLGCELGAQSKFNDKEGVSYINGDHDAIKLARLLEKFIKRFVLCYRCGNPETVIIITKSQMINLNCVACGFISEVDMTHKLITFILKNPPEPNKGSKTSGNHKKLKRHLKNEKNKKLKPDLKKRGPSDMGSKAAVHSGDSDDDDEDDVEWQTDTSALAAQLTIQEQLNSVTANMVALSTDEDKPKNDGVGSRISHHKELADEIRKYVEMVSPISEFKSLLQSLSGSHEEIIVALFEALFKGVGKGFAKELMKKKSYLVAAIYGEGSQEFVLNAIESFCRKVNVEMVKEVGLVLKVLYDTDVLEEEFIMRWYNEGLSGRNKGSPIWKNVKPFLEWLQTAESESEEE